MHPNVVRNRCLHLATLFAARAPAYYSHFPRINMKKRLCDYQKIVQTWLGYLRKVPTNRPHKRGLQGLQEQV